MKITNTGKKEIKMIINDIKGNFAIGVIFVAK